MVAIIDYGVGNINSIANMIKKIGYTDIVLAHNKSDIEKADKYILPGVGAFDTGMIMLNESGMRSELDHQVLINKKPILGICLGMQMLGKFSEEGKEPGLGYMPFSCKRFQTDELGLRVPHMGWDFVSVLKTNIDLVKNPFDELRFYFVHSFYAVCENSDDVLLECDYGIKFAAGVNRDNIYGAQFHPEKSHKYGKWLLNNFINEV